MKASARGYTNEQGIKCFKILVDGTEYFDVHRSGYSFADSTGREQQLKQWKQEALALAESPSDAPAENGVGIQSDWACVPPDVIAAMLSRGLPVDPEELKHTLDCYGMIQPTDAELIETFEHHKKARKVVLDAPNYRVEWPSESKRV